MSNVFSDLWVDNEHLGVNLETVGGCVNPHVAIKILSSVRKIVNIVNGEGYRVIFNGQEETAYVDYGKRTITISSKLLKSAPSNYSLYDIIDIETGLALHESGHVKYSINLAENENARNKLNSNIKRTLYNIIEDSIMEQIVSNDFPGYEGYFIKLRNHFFKNKNGEVAKSHNENANRINELFMGTRYTGNVVLSDPLAIEAVNIIKKTLKLNKKELRNVDRVQLTQDIYNLIIIEDKEDKEDDGQKDYQEGENRRSGDSNQGSNNNISSNLDNDSNKRDNDSNGNSGNNSDSKYDLDKEEIGGNIKEFLDSESKEKDFKLDNNDTESIKDFEEQEIEDSEEKGLKFSTFTCRPIINAAEKKQWEECKKRTKRLSTKFRNRFADANTIYRQNAYGLSRGNLDDDSLYSAKFNRNIFMNNTVVMNSRTKNIDIAFIIDCSGSMKATLGIYDGMYLDRITAAKDLAVLLTESLSNIKSVRPWVFGFQDSSSYFCQTLINGKSKFNVSSLPFEDFKKYNRATQVIRAYGPGDKDSSRIATLSADGGTPEYEALDSVIKILDKEGKKENKKVIVMLTDGEPSSYNFPRTRQFELIKQKVKDCKRKDTTIFHLSIDTHPTNRSPYENKILWNDQTGYEGLVSSFIKELNKQIS